MEFCKTGPGRKTAAELVFLVLVARIGSAAAGKWKVKIGVMNIMKDVLHDLGRPEAFPKHLGLQMPKLMSALRDATGDARKDVRQQAKELLVRMGMHPATNQEICGMSGDILASILDCPCAAGHGEYHFQEHCELVLFRAGLPLRVSCNAGAET